MPRPLPHQQLTSHRVKLSTLNFMSMRLQLLGAYWDDAPWPCALLLLLLTFSSSC